MFTWLSGKLSAGGGSVARTELNGGACSSKFSQCLLPTCRGEITVSLYIQHEKKKKKTIYQTGLAESMKAVKVLPLPFMLAGFMGC